MTEIEIAFANFDKKQLYVEKAYFMTKEIDLVREKKPFVTSIFSLNKDNVKFIQIKQDTIRQKSLQKHEKI